MKIARFARILFVPLMIAGAFAGATEFPIAGLQFNPELHLKVTQTVPAAAGQGFLWTASDENFEIVIKGIPMKDPKAAEQMARVELANIKNLYSPHGSPYAGQISDLIECKKGFLPKTVTAKIAGRKFEILMGGANARKLFGACTSDQIEYWAGYFSFYDARDGRAISVRAFNKAHAPQAKNVPHLEAKMKSILERLWMESKS